jgi:DNA-binding NarL/FixJ family response regulator
MVRVIGSAPAAPDTVQARRKLVADWCRLLGETVKPRPDETAGLSPRHVQTLQYLLSGDSEKEIAARLGVSPHTVHVYVKGLYRHFKVASRGELTARFVRRPDSAGPSAPVTEFPRSPA